MSNSTSYEELSKLIITAIEDEKFFNKEVLIPKIKAIMRGFRINLQSTRYNKIETPSESAKMLREIEKQDFQRTYWHNKLKQIVGNDEMEKYYDESDEILRQRGYNIPQRKKEAS